MCNKTVKTLKKVSLRYPIQGVRENVGGLPDSDRTLKNNMTNSHNFFFLVALPTEIGPPKGRHWKSIFLE